MSPSRTSESGNFASSVCIRPIIEPRWIASEFSACAISRPARIDDRGRVVVALLDVGRVRALHQRDVGLVGDRLEPVRDDFERDRIDAHAAMSHHEVEVRIDAWRGRPGKAAWWNRAARSPPGPRWYRRAAARRGRRPACPARHRPRTRPCGAMRLRPCRTCAASAGRVAGWRNLPTAIRRKFTISIGSAGLWKP